MSRLFGGLRIGAVVVAYNAETTLEKVLDRIPADVAAEVSAVLGKWVGARVWIGC